MKSVLRNANGQVAIFVALVFQVLFVFFAMVINVGLLVHHKINLQNSVDLAAYYGAMKQAESMNAIAHVNYQIRQSWKLFVFRYRHIGMAGKEDDHPYDISGKKIRSETDDKWDYKPAFCGLYYPFEPTVATKENYCKDIPVNRFTITLAPPPPFQGGIFFPGLQTAMTGMFNQQIVNSRGACEKLGETNWLMIARYLYAYRRDIANRKQVIYGIAQGISTDDKDMIDLDGQSVREGIYKTLTKNFTSANKEGFIKDVESGNTSTASLTITNSLGMENCKGGSAMTPPKWLSEIHVYPVLNYIDTECDTERKVIFENKYLNSPGSAPHYQKQQPQAIKDLLPYIQEPDGGADLSNLYKTSMGFEKNPWCMAYVGVEAKTTPKIPFASAGSITLTAKAYAKPFGAKIGPWYSSKWPSTSPKSTGGVRIDKMIPPRVDANMQPDDWTDVTLRPDFSRYVGDNMGTGTNLTYSQTGKAIHENGPISVNHWNHLIDKNDDLDQPNNSGDILAWDQDKDVGPKIRDAEISFVSPDHFDLAYYSIDADFYRNYAQRIDQGVKNGGKLKFPVKIRGDLGFRAKSKEQKLKVWGIRHQVEVASATNPIRNPFDLDKLKYYIKDAANLLNSWQSLNPEDFSIDTSRFGKCDRGAFQAAKGRYDAYDELADNKGVQGDCISGGRTGYSVKLVSEDHLKGEQNNIGGQGVSGQIKNAPP